MKTVLIVGGYGNVGAEVARMLSSDDRIRVIIGGRNLEIATTAASRLGCGVRQIDIDSPDSISTALTGVNIVLNCFSGPFTGHHLNLPEAALKYRVDYLDVTGSYEYSERVLRLNIAAREAGITMITALGANPGMSSVVMASNKAHFDVIETGEILFALGSDLRGISVGGLKELKHMFALQPLIWNGKWVKPQVNSKAIRIGAPINRKVWFGPTITRDLIILPDLLPIRLLECWSGMQGTMQATFMWLGLKWGLANTDKRAAWFLKFLKWLGNFPGSTPELLIRVTAVGSQKGKSKMRRIEICAEENFATAVSPTIAILQMVEGKTKVGGAFVAPQALDAEDFVKRLQTFGVRVKEEHI